MLPWRENGQVAWSATDKEREEISYWLAERRSYPLNERAIAVLVPPEANASIEGGFRWAMAVSWQDQPAWTAIGLLCIVLSMVDVVLKSF